MKKNSRTTTRVFDTQHISASSWYGVYRITRERHIFIDCVARLEDKIRIYYFSCILLRKDHKRHLHVMQQTHTVFVTHNVKVAILSTLSNMPAVLN